MCGGFSHTPNWGPDPQPRHVPLTGNRTRDPLVRSPALNPLRHTRQGPSSLFKSNEENVFG